IWQAPAAVSPEQIEGSYEGVCNRTLWPLYHSVVRPPEYHRRWWRRYVEVNEQFAATAADCAAPGGTVWVHDYHLQLVPALLRQKRSDIRIGYFLHIPFPPEELFVQLPWRRQVVDGLLGADVVGFQTRLDARNFLRVAGRLHAARRKHRQLQIEGRTVSVGTFPVSIDAARYAAVAEQPEVVAQAEQLKLQLGNARKVLLGVDRMDYTKGIDVRLRAFQQLLANRPGAAQEAVFVQVAVPSRERIAEYQELRRVVEELVGQINGEHGEVGTAVVHYLHRNLPFEELIAMYQAADIMIVTPLCDGMNLVAKEYVATRFDDTGVLVLSEFAGASAELRTALTVNPHDVNGMAEAMERALVMRPAEVRRRMRVMRRTVLEHDVNRWARRFLQALRG
ncbi:MAG: trehalose-6-phosphate synthase, partial [Gemmatimonadales bacterium]|nr:trehalose-6-phosphate synthase [Gemmatimonadales bacterium]